MPQTIKSHTGRTLILPTPEEDVAISAGIAADPDTHELTVAEFAQLKPIPQRGRPASANPKVHTGLRLDAEVLDAFKAGGRGWQTRINEALKEWLKNHHTA
ncbi:MAG: BrnA antitoxin family protein [Sideroxydans sp.]|nr:BrnA antitoxin family protein [Sideroxydans sp.]